MMGKQVRENAQQNSAATSTKGRFAPRPFAPPEPEHESLGRVARFGHSFGEIGLFPIQPKLKLSPPNDKYEREADRVAEQVMRMPVPCPKCQSNEEALQARPLADQIAPLVRQSSIKPKTVQRQKLTPFEEQEVDALKPLYEIGNRTKYSCIGILNKAVLTLYSEKLKGEKLGSTIQDTMNALGKLNVVGAPVVIEFFDAKGNITTGMEKPKNLSQSMEKLVLSSSAPLKGWYLYGLSIMDGYHSVLLAVDATSDSKKVYWLDQIGGFVDVTGNLDGHIETKTVSWWQAVLDGKGKRYRTRATIWFFNVVLGDFPLPSGETAYA